MYPPLLFLHSWGRWFMLGAGLLAVGRAYAGWSGHRPLMSGDTAARAAFAGFLGRQGLVGLGLYLGGSPWGLPAMQQPGALPNPTTRFFSVERGVMLLLAARLAQVGRLALKKAPADVHMHRKAFRYFGGAWLLVLLLIPWGRWNPRG